MLEKEIILIHRNQTLLLLFPVLGQLRPAMDITKHIPSISLKAFLRFFLLLADVLKTILESRQSLSCQRVSFSNFFSTVLQILVFWLNLFHDARITSIAFINVLLNYEYLTTGFQHS
jgi:hypothetical protein